MDNQKVLNQAIELLKDLDLTDAESVQINNTKYDDGSSLIEVGVSFPAERDEELSPAAASLLKEIRNERKKVWAHEKT